MRHLIHQNQVPRDIPVRWFNQTWDVAVGESDAGGTVAVTAAPRPATAEPDAEVRQNPRAKRRITVTTRKGFSQPSRAQRHRR